jgi:hypothetical protein
MERIEKFIKWIAKSIFEQTGKILSADVLIYAVKDMVVYAVSRPELSVDDRDQIITLLIEFDTHINDLIKQLTSRNAVARDLSKALRP